MKEDFFISFFLHVNIRGGAFTYEVMEFLLHGGNLRPADFNPYFDSRSQELDLEAVIGLIINICL